MQCTQSHAVSLKRLPGQARQLNILLLKKPYTNRPNTPNEEHIFIHLARVLQMLTTHLD